MKSGSWIPGYRNPVTRLLECAVVMGTDRDDVLTEGRRYDKVLHNASVSLLHRAESRPILAASYAKMCTLSDRVVPCTCAVDGKNCHCDEDPPKADQAAVCALFADDPDGAVIFS